MQIIMAARVLYGLAAQGLLPAALARVNRTTRTPLVATALITAVILTLAVALPIVPLAQATSALTLAIFALVNLALWRIKRRDPGADRDFHRARLGAGRRMFRQRRISGSGPAPPGGGIIPKVLNIDP
jgi:amino acid transporter